MGANAKIAVSVFGVTIVSRTLIVEVRGALRVFEVAADGGVRLH
jgi:hypothetical protein